MTKDEAQHSRWTFYEAVNPFRPLQPIQSPELMVKLKQLSAPSLVFGMLHTIARRDTMLMDYRSADIHGLGPRSGPTGGDLTGGDKPHKRSNKVFRDQASPKQFD